MNRTKLNIGNFELITNGLKFIIEGKYLSTPHNIEINTGIRNLQIIKIIE